MKKLYITIGALIGLLCGGFIGVGASLLTSAALWMFVFGDSPWPDSTKYIVYAAGVLPAIILFIIGVMVGKSKGEAAELLSPDVQASAKKKSSVVLFVVLVLIALSAGSLFSRANKQRKNVQLWLESNDVIDYGAYEILDVLSLPRLDKSGFEILVSMQGSNPGQYLMRIKITDTVYKKVLVQKDEIIRMSESFESYDLFVDYNDLMKQYHSQILNSQPAQVWVVDDFTVTASLTPASRPQAPAITESSSTFHVDFRITGTTYQISP